MLHKLRCIPSLNFLVCLKMLPCPPRLNAYTAQYDKISIFMKAEGWPANDVRYHAVDPQETLATVLRGKMIVEYPTLLVVLPEDLDAYPIAPPPLLSPPTPAQTTALAQAPVAAAVATATDNMGHGSDAAATHETEASQHSRIAGAAPVMSQAVVMVMPLAGLSTGQSQSSPQQLHHPAMTVMRPGGYIGGAAAPPAFAPGAIPMMRPEPRHRA